MKENKWWIALALFTTLMFSLCMMSGLLIRDYIKHNPSSTSIQAKPKIISEKIEISGENENILNLHLTKPFSDSARASLVVWPDDNDKRNWFQMVSETTIVDGKVDNWYSYDLYKNLLIQDPLFPGFKYNVDYNIQFKYVDFNLNETICVSKCGSNEYNKNYKINIKEPKDTSKPDTITIEKEVITPVVIGTLIVMGLVSIGAIIYTVIHYSIHRKEKE